jgi:PE-PPE domain/PE family
VSILFARPDVLAAAAADLADVGSSVRDANAAASALTTEILAPAEDEVSTAVAGLFGKFAQQFQALGEHAASFHDDFVQGLRAGAGSYVAAETSSAAALLETAQQNVLGGLRASTGQFERLLSGAGTSGAGAAVRAGLAQPLAGLVGNTFVMGGTGMPTPSTAFLNAVNDLFIQRNLPGTNPVGLTTPEQTYPFTGVRSLLSSVSISQGVQILDNALQPYISAGTSVGVFGYSQSATIASLEMRALEAAGVPSSAVHFVLIGDPMNPNGGFFERFAGLNLSALGIDFSGATPSNAYPTTIYTTEYDAFADFPRYPLNILSDLNSIASQTHFSYTGLTPAQVADAIKLPTSTADSLTSYYMIPTANLPLLDGLRNIPILGNPVADLLQPDLRYLVNLGYGDPLYGWSTSYADVPTQFGLLPPLKSFEELPGLLVSGAHQGVQDFVGDFTGSGPHPVTLPSLTSLLGTSSVTGGTTGAVSNPLAGLASITPASLGTEITNFTDTVGTSLSNAYYNLRPTADILNAALFSVPAYDVNLFLDGISQAINGQPVMGLINAFGRPLAADIALYMVLASYEKAIL